jgi:hypothetical protein
MRCKSPPCTLLPCTVTPLPPVAGPALALALPHRSRARPNRVRSWPASRLAYTARVLQPQLHSHAPALRRIRVLQLPTRPAACVACAPVLRSCTAREPLLRRLNRAAPVPALAPRLLQRLLLRCACSSPRQRLHTPPAPHVCCRRSRACAACRPRLRRPLGARSRALLTRTSGVAHAAAACARRATRLRSPLIAPASQLPRARSNAFRAARARTRLEPRCAASSRPPLGPLLRCRRARAVARACAPRAAGSAPAACAEPQPRPAPAPGGGEGGRGSRRCAAGGEKRVKGRQEEDKQRERKNRGGREKELPKDLCVNSENCRDLSVKHKLLINLKPE